jgi:GNAT superfamily N-acetyltransferase
MPVTIIPATEKDVPLVFEFVRKLAEYEKLSHHVTATENDLRENLFGDRRAAEAVIAYLDDAPAGLAVFFHNFSTYTGKPGIYLEDLFVDPEYRRRGVGKALLKYLERLGRERGCDRLQWSVLKWNESAIRFYKSRGAVPMEDWTLYRLSLRR